MLSNRIGLYIDFDNCYASMLDMIEDLYYEKNLDTVNDQKKVHDRIKKELDKTIRNLINKIEEHFDISNQSEQKNNIVYAKAFSDFNRLPYSESINIIDILHKNGIKTFYPYIRKNKDMSDRALIINIIEDIFFKQKQSNNIDTLILLTGDIDYLPLLDFFIEYSKTNFYLLSFKNRYSPAYDDIFYMKNKIIFIDDLFNVDTTEIEDEKKYKIFSEEIFKCENKTSKWLSDKHFKKTISDINNKCYFRLEEDRAKRFITRLLNENKITNEDIYLSFRKN